VAAPVVLIFRSLEDLSRRAADHFVGAAKSAIGAHGVFRAALSGGSTPRRLYELLGSEEYIEQVDWDNTQLFWGDERCVPATDPRSNFRMAGNALLYNVPAALHRIRGEKDPEAVAYEYENEIRRAFGLKMPGELPRFDLMLLGMGADGHTASLFPGTSVIKERRRLAVPVYNMVLTRVTLTLPVLNNAARVLFLVTGKEKAATVQHILEGDNRKGYPAGLVAPRGGEVTWLLDRAAASRLKHTGIEAPL